MLDDAYQSEKRAWLKLFDCVLMKVNFERILNLRRPLPHPSAILKKPDPQSRKIRMSMINHDMA